MNVNSKLENQTVETDQWRELTVNELDRVGGGWCYSNSKTKTVNKKTGAITSPTSCTGLSA